jgi:hypothetical protein
MSSRLRSGTEGGIAPALGAVDDKLPSPELLQRFGSAPITSPDLTQVCYRYQGGGLNPTCRRNLHLHICCVFTTELDIDINFV